MRNLIPHADRLNLTQEEAAGFLGVSRPSIAKLIAGGEIATIRLGARTLVPKSELIRWNAEQIAKVRDGAA